MNNKRVFICFSSKDRYRIVQPIVYNLKNYGVDIWYDRNELLLGDNRYEKNILDGAQKCKYAIVVLSENTISSLCATEEIRIIEERYNEDRVVVFPVLYELKPDDIPETFGWVKKLIYKEVNHSSGSLEICNHIACKITEDVLDDYKYRSIAEVLDAELLLPKPAIELLTKYCHIDRNNINSRVSLLYSIYTILKCDASPIKHNLDVPNKSFERLFNETLLNLDIDYREIWLLENSLCIMINDCYTSCK